MLVRLREDKIFVSCACCNSPDCETMYSFRKRAREAIELNGGALAVCDEAICILLENYEISDDAFEAMRARYLFATVYPSYRRMKALKDSIVQFRDASVLNRTGKRLDLDKL